MSLEQIILGGMLLLEIIVSLYFLTCNATDARERMEALMQSKAHIAALAAEVLPHDR
jgi:hypothetical protein